MEDNSILECYTELPHQCEEWVEILEKIHSEYIMKLRAQAQAHSHAQARCLQSDRKYRCMLLSCT